MSKNVIYKSPSNPESGQAYTDTVADYSSAVVGDNTLVDVTCDSSVSVGNVVRLNGSTFVNAQADNFTNSKAVGICTSKSNSTTCNILVAGFTDSILSGLTSSSIYFLSDTTAGQLTSTPPSVSGSYVIRIGIAYTANRLILNIERVVRRV